ncbi:D-alanyl-D-alanine carboxypeptidase family protein [Roseitranquillus sediminis]|uniref:D-alanyl-D-alanine carboxypeptidase family protein n=1 Tax=Roseitranquillus sediminis TaxID=2809051 RepID=UPI001D0CB129|nr:D-alanyl-D-alanine carboxypeptidase family protein [Roseitranquillus sediminis]MBM9593256.1 serine hydrolase [Roseitranquillus sediminis]
MFVPLVAVAAPYAAMVIDARTGEVLHSRNADTRLHPASLTKMMTLYIAFQAVENGEISLDTPVTISRNAAAEPPSKLGLRAGQRIQFRYLIRAAAVKSANDAATAIGEAIAGSEAAFARRMNRTARALGMSRTSFKNAHGLTENGHLSTARDMTTLGRRLFFDHPQYYNLFSRRATNAGGTEVYNTNRRFLAAYRGADGIKTGYTRAAGFNLVASAERGTERIIATMFGGSSTAARNKRVAELLDMGFSRAATHVAVVRPPAVNFDVQEPTHAARNALAVATSLRPPSNPRHVALALAETVSRPIETTAAVAEALGEAAAPLIEGAVTAALDTDDATTTGGPATVEEAAEAVAIALAVDTTAAEPEAQGAAAADSPTALALADAQAVAPAEVEADDEIRAALAEAIGSAPADDPAGAVAFASSLRPAPRPEQSVEVASVAPQPQIVARLSTSGGRHWGINIGRYGSRYEAERILLQTALNEVETLDEALRKVVRQPTGFDANFVGMTQGRAELACNRLAARQLDCTPIGPS